MRSTKVRPRDLAAKLKERELQKLTGEVGSGQCHECNGKNECASQHATGDDRQLVQPPKPSGAAGTVRRFGT